MWQLITLPKSEGGAGITPKQGEWKLVESVFPLHDHKFNKVCISTLCAAYMYFKLIWSIGVDEEMVDHLDSQSGRAREAP